MAGVSDDWRWVDPRGVQSTTDKWELVSLLSTAELPYYTLVWRQGWGEWLPACRVDELAQAVGEAAEPAVKPRADPTAKLPPPPPLYKYHAYQVRESQPSKSAKAPGEAAFTREPLGPPADTNELGRRPMPTLADEPSPARGGATLRPPAAVPPPPRAMPKGPQASKSGAARDAILEELVPGSTAAVPLDPVPPASDDRLRPEPSAETTTSAPRPVVPDLRDAPPGRAVEASSTTLIVAAGLIAVLAVLLGAAAVVILLGRRGPAPSTSVSTQTIAPASEAVASASSAPASTRKQCLMARSGRRIYGAAERSVPPLLRTLPDQRVAVGFAASSTTAVGLLIDPVSLTTKQELLETEDESVDGVVPLYTEELRFSVDREGGPLGQVHTLAPDLRIGISDDGVARQRGDQVEVVWAGGAGEATTAPRTATVAGRGHVVTFRRGGQSGAVLVGWLTLEGEQAGPLGQVAGEGLSGTPSVAVNPTSILVTFASRPDPDAKWGVALALAPHGGVPKTSVPFVIPPGGPGVETIAPAATGLDDGRWVLQWTEGATGNRQVRVQTLAADLTPIGDAITLSAVEDNAGQGVLHAVGGQVLSLFLVIRGGERQLWAAALKCD
jgi:hypothetical protein